MIDNELELLSLCFTADLEDVLIKNTIGEDNQEEEFDNEFCSPIF